MTTTLDLGELFRRMTGDEKHECAATSTLDVLWVLYDRVLDVSPATVGDPDRDRFLLSKGHGPMAYYAVLAAKGFLDPATLDDWTTFASPLGQHPDRNLVPGVEIGSGSLGHGLALAGRRMNLGNLTAITVDNGSASHGWPGGIASRFAVEGWHATTVDGRDHDALYTALTTRHDGPNAVVATIREA